MLKLNDKRCKMNFDLGFLDGFNNRTIRRQNIDYLKGYKAGQELIKYRKTLRNKTL